MKNVTISTFSLRVKSHTGREVEYCTLDKLPAATQRKDLPSHRSLLGLLEEYLRLVEKHAANDKINRSLLSASQIHVKSHSVSAFLERGEYGIQSNMLDAGSVKKKKITYRRLIRDAEMLPYYFLAAVPARSQWGVVAFEMEANAGIKSQFEQGFEDFLRAECGRCDLEINRLVPGKLVKQFLKHGRVSRLRFVRLNVPSSIEEAFMLDGNIETSATMELRVKPKQGSAFLLADKIQDVLSKQREARDFVQIQGFEYDTVKVDVKVGNKYHTVDLGNLDSFRADYDITNKVQPNGGHPTYRSIDQIAREIVREIMDSLNLDTTGV